MKTKTIKAVYLTVMMLFLAGSMVAQNQNVGINNTGSSPDPSAILDVSSTTKGFLPPRMTQVQRNAIVSPAAGLIIWCSNCGINGELQVFNGASWTNISGTVAAAAVPGAPVIGTATAGNGQASVSFTQPASNGGSAITSYTATSTPGSITGTLNQAGSGTIVVSGLTNGTAYTFTVKATNAIGTGPASSASNSVTPTSTAFLCGSSIAINHVAGVVAPVTKAVTYGTVTNIPGEPTKCWITRNLGASQQATIVSDATEASAGWYWQFNRKQGYKHDGTTRTPNTTWTTSINESSDWITANDPCNIELGTTWHIPTYTEWYNVNSIGGWTNWNGEWSSGLKLHVAGLLNYSGGSLTNRGTSGLYWSSTQLDATTGWELGFSSGGSLVDKNYKTFGYSARCVRD